MSLLAVRLAGEAHRRLVGLGIDLPPKDRLEEAAVARTRRLPSSLRNRPGEPDPETTREIWRAVRSAVLESVERESRGGSSSPIVKTGGPGEGYPSRQGCVWVLDSMTEVHRLAACQRWVDGLHAREIAGALRQRYSVGISPPEVLEVLQEVRRQMGAGGPPGRLGCGLHSTALASLIEGESLLKRQERKVLDHLSSCGPCSRTLEAYREADRRLGNELVRACSDHPGLSGLEEYRTEIVSSPTRKHLLDRHLGRCAECRSLLEALRSLGEVDPDLLLSAGSLRGRLRLAVTWTLVLGPLLAVGYGAWVLNARRDDDKVRDYRSAGLVDLHLDYARGQWPWKGLPRDEDPLWRAALAAYDEGSCAEAADRFLEYVSAVGEDPVGPLFLGASLLCADHPGRAARVLETVAGNDEGQVWEEGAWLLSHAHLAGGDLDRARQTLQELYLRGDVRSEDARETLDRLR